MNKEIEPVISFMHSLFSDLENIQNELKDHAEELQDTIRKRDFSRTIEISAEIIALCGSIVPLENLKEGIELALNKDTLQ